METVEVPEEIPAGELLYSSPPFGEAEASLSVGRDILDPRELDERIAALEEAIRKQGDAPALRSTLGKLYCLRHTDADARRAIRHLRTARGLAPRDGMIALSLGFAYISVQDWENAENTLRRARALVDSPVDKAAVHTALGIVFVSRGKVDDAVASFRSAVDLNPRDSFPALQLGQLLYELGRNNGERQQMLLEEALSVYQRLIDTDPTLVAAVTNAGVVLNALGRAAESEAMARRALALEPDNLFALLNLANSTLNSGRLTGAIDLYDRAFDALTEQGMPAHMRAEALNGRGLSLIRLYLSQDETSREIGLLDEAAKALRAANELAPRRPDILASRAVVESLAGRFDEAVGLYEKSLRIDPGYSVAIKNLAEIASSEQVPVETRHRVEAILALAMAVLTGDAQAFSSALGDENRRLFVESDFRLAAEFAFRVGAVRTAYSLITEGAARFPEDDWLSRAQRVTEPGPARTVSAKHRSDPKKDRAWLDAHSAEHRGQWVALRDGVLVAAESTLAEIKEKLGSLDDIFVTKVYG